MRIRSAVAASLCLALALVGCAGPPPSTDAETMTIVVLPHPDDEFQVWSQVEQRSDEFTVFVLMTRGEQTQYCGEHGGLWSEQCASDRLDSWLEFFSRMGPSDATMPSDFGDPHVVTGLDVAEGVARDDDGQSVAPGDPLVWSDAEGRGALIAFDLGDGDLTPQEVEWAVQAVLEDRDAFRMPDLPLDRVIGAYAYEGTVDGCFPYPHADHVAVAAAIDETDFGATTQLWSSCSLDPDAGVSATATVSDAAASAAFGDDGAFPASYGWLGPWPFVDDESELFHGTQGFVTR